jgi:hypothetical protein
MVSPTSLSEQQPCIRRHYEHKFFAWPEHHLAPPQCRFRRLLAQRAARS